VISQDLAALKLPRFSPAAMQFLAHVLIVFAIAFGGQLTAGATHAVSMPTLLALLTSAAAAGLTAVVHFLLGLVPTGVQPPVAQGNGMYAAVGALSTVSLKVKTRAYQILVSVLATFLSLFGAALVAGAVHVTSLPGTIDAVTAAISAAVVGVVQFAVGLIPAPKPATS